MIYRLNFHEFILHKIREVSDDKLWMKDVSSWRVEYFGQVNQSVHKIASALTKIGLKKGDVVCMYCSNYVDYWLVVLAAWTCGACIMPVNCELEPNLLECQLSSVNAKVRTSCK